MNSNHIWLVHSLGRRVVLTGRLGDLPRGRTGTLVSIQSGVEDPAVGPYATVAFDLADMTDEENVPLHLLRPFDVEVMHRAPR